MYFQERTFFCRNVCFNLGEGGPGTSIVYTLKIVPRMMVLVSATPGEAAIQARPFHH